MIDTEACVARYHELNAFLDKQNEAFAAFCKPYREEIEAIQSTLLGFLNDAKQNGGKTDHGSFYKSTLTRPKIVDRNAYLDYIFQNWNEGGNAMLQVGAPQLDAFKDYVEHREKELEAHVANLGKLPDDTSLTPPGIEVTYITKLNIRKT